MNTNWTLIHNAVKFIWVRFRFDSTYYSTQMSQSIKWNWKHARTSKTTAHNTWWNTRTHRYSPAREKMNCGTYRTHKSSNTISKARWSKTTKNWLNNVKLCERLANDRQYMGECCILYFDFILKTKTSQNISGNLPFDRANFNRFELMCSPYVKQTYMAILTWVFVCCWT